MPERIAKANIDHFKELLETDKDPQKRGVIERLLSEEKEKLSALLQQKSKSENKEG